MKMRSIITQIRSASMKEGMKHIPQTLLTQVAITTRIVAITTSIVTPGE